LEYDRRKRLIMCRARKAPTLPLRYLGADDRVGPNYTGQAAVTSHYEHLPIEIAGTSTHPSEPSPTNIA
jgi:hypothetical protein